MMDLGEHATYIWAAYGAVLFVLAALTGWIVADARRQRQTLEALEAQGVSHRSVRGKGKSEEVKAS